MFIYLQTGIYISMKAKQILESLDELTFHQYSAIMDDIGLKTSMELLTS